MDPARADTRGFGSDGNAQKKTEWRDPRFSDKWGEFRVKTKMAQRRSLGGIFENFVFCYRYSRLAS